MIDDVVALYVDPRGPYPKLVREWWDEARDARTYAGPWPVVAHPPCGPWGRLRHLCSKQDGSLAPLAVAEVRRSGGVLEHPAWSLLFDRFGLPRPGELPDAWGGRTFEVNQCDWGHVARKPTWLYVVGLSDIGALPPRRQPTHYISGARDRRDKRGGPVPPGFKICSAEQRRRTPPAFAEFLISLARASKPSPGATSPRPEPHGAAPDRDVNDVRCAAPEAGLGDRTGRWRP